MKGNIGYTPASKLQGTLAVLLAIALALAGAFALQQREDKQHEQVKTDAQNVAADVTGTTQQVLDAFPSVAAKPQRKAIDIPTVLTRVGWTPAYGTHVVPTQWCQDHHAICENAMEDRFAAKAKQDPSNQPTPHALDNMHRVWNNSWGINPKAMGQTSACDKLCAWNHYKSDALGGICQMEYYYPDGFSLGNPAYPMCNGVTWGGADGTEGGHNMDNVDKGWIVCETTILGTGAGELVFGVTAPVAGITVGAGSFGCGAGWVMGKYLWRD